MLSRKQGKYPPGLYILSALIFLLVASVLLAPKVNANVYPTAADHQGISAKSGNWRNPPSNPGNYNCRPDLYPGGQTPGACSTGLEASFSRYKLFRNVSSPRAALPGNSTDLIIEDGCKDVTDTNPHKKPVHPDKGVRQIRVWIARTATAPDNPDENISRGQVSGRVVSTAQNFDNTSTGTCFAPAGSPFATDLRVPVPAAAFSYAQADRYGDYTQTALVAILKHQGRAGEKRFKLNYSAGRVYGDDDGYFALASNRVSGDSSPYVLRFKADCRYRNERVSIGIGDTDFYNEGVEPGFPTMTVYDETAGTNVPADNNVEDDRAYTIAPNGLKPGHTYKITISKIESSNGIRLRLPYSEFPFFDNTGCIPTPEDQSCKAITHTLSGHSRYRFTTFAKKGPNYMSNGPPFNGQTKKTAGNAPQDWRTFTQAPVAQWQDVNTGNGSDTRSYNYPAPAGPDWVTYIEKWQGEGKGPYEYTTNQTPKSTPDTCFKAKCEAISITAGALPGRPKGVEAGRPFTLSMTIKNIGLANLPQNTRGHNLIAREGSWPFSSPPVSGGLLRNESKNTSVALTAPGSIQTKNVNPYADYYGLFAMDGGCPMTISVYNKFLLDPKVASVTANDPEDPTEIKYSTNINQNKAAPYTSQTIPATSARGLYWKRGGVNQGYLQGATADSRNFSDPNPYPYNDIYDNTTVPRDFRAGDEFCAVISIDRYSGWIGPGNDITGQVARTDEDCNKVVDRPFVRAYGSDVFSGGKFGQPGAGTSGDIKTYLKRATNVPEGSSFGAGSGVEFGAFALGVIERTSDLSTGFNSASLRSSAPAAPSGLAFASPGAGFGGDFASAHMATDYFNSTKKHDTQVTNPVSSQAVNGLPDRQQSGFKPSGKLTLTGGTNYNSHHSLYVDGDVFISDNIAYGGSGGWANLDAIPSFALYVKGNIYIKNSVNKLDGLYVAQPKDDGSGGGKIYTCADASGNLFGSGNIFTQCRNQLKVNGSFIAQETKLLRTAGTLSDVPVAANASPGTPGSDGIRDGAYTFAWWLLPGIQTGRSKCLAMDESSDPNWPKPSDNQFCYNSDHTLKWYSGGATGGSPAPGEECTSLNNPSVGSQYGWADNYICAPAGSDLELEMVYSGPDPPGKNCTAINEVAWTGSGQAWNGKFCYRGTPKPSVGGAPLQYSKEIFANDHAAESFRIAPELYLAQPVQQSIGSQSNGKYDQFLVLPPIL